jgi:3-oxoisoapionate kinase
MSTPRPLPAGPLIVFYGDDFTGSSAVMEATAFADLDTVLFLSEPTPERLAAFASYRVIGIAGTARSQSPEWMDRHLPPVFRLLCSLKAPVAHYKVCSTFDSAPHIGSIGRATDLAGAIFKSDWIPMIVGDPGMARFQSFGNLFAMANGVGHRLDRHPAMSRHPVTPMDEADLSRHLGKQTAKRIGLVDFVAMKRGEADERLSRERAAGAEIVSLDVMDHETLVAAGRLVWERGGERLFGIGSQGFEAALVAYWRSVQLIPAEPASYRAPAVDRIAGVSGSVSPITAAQIAFSLQNGFAGIPLDASRAVEEEEWRRETERVADRALKMLGEGRDPLIYTASGPDDPAVVALKTALEASGASPEAVNERIGTGLGEILDRTVREGRLRRAVISGGDTSGRAASVLGIDALTAVAAIAPGSPLCRAHSAGGVFEGLEIALKGGQVGGADFFCAAKQGTMSTIGAAQRR